VNVTMTVKSGQFTEDMMGKGQFLWGSQRNLDEQSCEKDFVFN